MNKNGQENFKTSISHCSFYGAQYKMWHGQNVGRST